MLLETKSLLAKLMATENLHIEQRKVDTASFNTKTRVLTVPILDKDVPDYTYDLFMGHEVGHALWTPYDGWVEAQIKDKINKDVLNVVEDSRIERKIKYKYPGLRHSFVKAYNDLFEQDFFSVLGKDLDKLNFIDRINLHQKIGASLNIHFNEKERELLGEVEKTDKFEDVLVVTKKIQDYIKEQVKEQLKTKPQKQKVKVVLKEVDEDTEAGEQPMEIPEGIDPDADTEFEFEFQPKEDTEGEEKPDESQQTKPESGEPVEESDDEVPVGTGESEETEPEPEESEQEESSGGGQTKFEQQLQEALENEMRSFTDEAYKEKEKTLFDDGPGSFTYVNIPRMDTKRCILDYKTLYLDYKMGGHKTDDAAFMRIRNESNKVVSYLVKEFELRKNADEMKRASTAKTGDLNMNKIFAYKFTEDIFKKITVIPGGKSHGLVMFLDWSGSMHSHLENTVKQLISLVLFCKKVNIPYEVYAFLDETHTTHTGRQLTKNTNELVLGKLSLANMLSSRMSATDFSYACGALVHLSRTYTHPHWLRMNSTPLNESIVAAMDIIPEFQKKHRLQIVNTVFLTDGDGNFQRTYYSDTASSMYDRTMSIDCRNNSVVVVRDPITKNEVKIMMNGRNHATAITNALIKLLKLRTHCNIVGFYVISGREFGYSAERWYEPEQIDQAKESFKKDRYAVLTNSGFDEYYFLRSSGLNTDDEAFDVDTTTVTQRGLVSAFSKYAGNKIENRVVLNRFIGMIA